MPLSPTTLEEPESTGTPGADIIFNYNFGLINAMFSAATSVGSILYRLVAWALIKADPNSTLSAGDTLLWDGQKFEPTKGEKIFKASIDLTSSGTVNLFTLTGDFIVKSITLVYTNIVNVTVAPSLSIGVSGDTDSVVSSTTLSGGQDQFEILTINAPADIPSAALVVQKTAGTADNFSLDVYINVQSV